MLEFSAFTFPQLIIFDVCIFATGYACAGEGLPWWFRIFLFITIIDVYWELMKLTENKFGGKKI
jgi:hypothetical protein